MTKELRVTGKGNIQVVPDLTIVSVTLSKTETTYKQALVSSSKESKELKELLLPLGIKEESIKTKMFNVEPHYAYYKDKYGDSKSKVDGYTFNHRVNFKFDIDNKLLGKILYQLTKSKTASNIEINYSFKDVEGAKNKLLKSAVDDAFKKAKILEESTGVKLVNISSINYSFDELEITVNPYSRRFTQNLLCDCGCNGTIDLDVNPDDISLGDVVTITWEIE